MRGVSDSQWATAHKGAVTAMTLARDKLVSGSEDGAIKIWDLATGDGPRTVWSHDYGICSLLYLATNEVAGDTTLDPMGWKLALGSGDNTIVICGVQEDNIETLATMRGHSGAVHAMLWIETRGWLVTGATDSSVRVWRVN